MPDPVLASRVRPLVLLVDSHLDTRELYGIWLERAGLHVVHAASADEALHLVASEMGLPVIDGYEFCRRLRQRPETRDLPIIAVTAWAMPAEVQLAWEVGCDAVLPKPCAPETLLAAIARLLRLPSAPVARPS